MIKKLSLIFCLGLATQAPVAAAYPKKDSSAQEVVERIAKIGGVVAFTAGTVYLVATYPQFFGELAGALIRGLANYHYCYHCDCHHYGHCHHVTVTTYTTYRY